MKVILFSLNYIEMSTNISDFNFRIQTVRYRYGRRHHNPLRAIFADGIRPQDLIAASWHAVLIEKSN